MRKWLACGVWVPFVAMMWSACGSGDTNNADAASDVTVKDQVTADKKVIPDVGQPDVPQGCAPATTVDTTQFTWSPPTPSPTACSAQQILDDVANCWDTAASTAKCNAWTSANTACAACMETNENAGHYGALINTGHGVVYANVGGCLALVANDLTQTGCGGKYWTASQCEDLDCAANCPVTDTASFTAYQNCTKAAATGVCASYVAAECDTAADAGAPYDQCIAPLTNAASFAALVQAYGPVFCGGYASDGGASDASTDGPDGG